MKQVAQVILYATAVFLLCMLAYSYGFEQGQATHTDEQITVAVFGEVQTWLHGWHVADSIFRKAEEDR